MVTIPVCEGGKEERPKEDEGKVVFFLFFYQEESRPSDNEASTKTQETSEVYASCLLQKYLGVQSAARRTELQ